MADYLSASDQATAGWSELEELIRQASDLTESDLSVIEFYNSLLNIAISGLNAHGGSVWQLNGSGQIQLLAKVGVEHDHGTDQTARIASLFQSKTPAESTIEYGRPGASAGNFGTTSDVILYPVRFQSSTVAVVEIMSPRVLDDSAAALRARQFVAALCELAADYHTNHELRSLQNDRFKRDSLDRFMESVHKSLDLETTAYAIASDGRKVIGCHRLSLLEIVGKSRCRTLAISGVDTVDRHSSSVLALERLSATMISEDNSLSYPEALKRVSPQMEESIRQYVDQQHARQLTIVPLQVAEQEDSATLNNEKPASLGFLVAEMYDAETSTDELLASTERVARIAAPALRSALAYNRMPFLPVQLLIAKSLRLFTYGNLPKMVAAVSVAALFAAAAMLLEVDLVIEAKGQVQPRVRRNLFATTDGIIHRIAVKHGDRVSAGEVLMEMTQSELEVELGRITGELKTAQSQLRTARAKQWKTQRDQTAQQDHLLAAEIERLKQYIDGLNQQLEVVTEHQKRLVVRSPIDGVVQTWDVEQLFSDRPVGRGQLMMTVADDSGPWVLELNVRDNDMGPILAARHRSGAPLEATFLLASDPTKTHSGSLEEIGTTAVTDQNGITTVPIRVGFDRRHVAGLRPGASVTAELKCGRRSIGYVWLRDLVNVLRLHVFF